MIREHRGDITAVCTWLTQIDQFVTRWAIAHRTPAFTVLMWMVSLIGGHGLVWYVTGAACGVVGRMRWEAVARLFISLLLAAFLSDLLLKPLIARPRPFVLWPALIVIGGRPSDASFPSGHAAHAFAGAVMLAGALPKSRWIWWTLAMLIAYSRVYLGVHYLSDVIGGAVVGAISGATVRRLSRHRIGQGRT